MFTRHQQAMSLLLRVDSITDICERRADWSRVQVNWCNPSAKGSPTPSERADYANAQAQLLIEKYKLKLKYENKTNAKSNDQIVAKIKDIL
jgi:hypothetical protein